MTENPGGALTYRGCAMSWQCDQMGHMNARFLYAAFDDATSSFFSHLNCPLSQVRASAVGWAGVHQQIDFLREVRDSEAISIMTNVMRLGQKSITFLHTMNTDEHSEPAARMTNKTVRFDIKSRRASLLEEKVRERAAAFLAEAAT